MIFSNNQTFANLRDPYLWPKSEVVWCFLFGDLHFDKVLPCSVRFVPSNPKLTAKALKINGWKMKTWTFFGAKGLCSGVMLVSGSVILLMEEILHQLIDSLSHHLKGFIQYIPGGAGFLPSTVCLKWLGNHPFLDVFAASVIFFELPEPDGKTHQKSPSKFLKVKLCPGSRKIIVLVVGLFHPQFQGTIFFYGF